MGKTTEAVEKDDTEKPAVGCGPRIMELKAAIIKILEIFIPKEIRDESMEMIARAMKASLDEDDEETLIKKLQILAKAVQDEAVEMESVIVNKLVTGGVNDCSGPAVPGDISKQ